MPAAYLDKISELTFSVHHNPNCASPFQVHLIAPGNACLDNITGEKTKDITGHGQTLEAAARDAWRQRLKKLKKKRR